MLSVRERIVEQLRNTIDAVSEIKSAKVQRGTVINLSQVRFPSVFIDIVSQSENLSARTNKHEGWDMQVSCSIFTEPDDAEKNIAEIHKAVLANNQMGGLAIDTNLQSIVSLEIENDDSLKIEQMLFNITFRNEQGEPYQ
jgi:hypothetical protein